MKNQEEEEKKEKRKVVGKGEHFNMLGKEKQRARSASELIERSEVNPLEERKRSGLETAEKRMNCK